MKVLSSSTYDDGVNNFQDIEKLKICFKQPDKIFKNIKLRSLLVEGGILLKNNSHKKDFLISYGLKLINCIGKDVTLDAELFNQLEYILMELQLEGESLTDKLFIKISQLQNESFLHFDGILKMSKITFERRILDWIENNSSDMEYLAKVSANSSKLFQSIISIFYSILLQTHGHWRVFEVIKSFICLVVSFCTKNGKDFLSLYPENCRRIVSLLIVSPVLYSDEIIKNEVLGLLMEMFLVDKKKILILLSHYTDWLCVFRNYLVKKRNS